MKVIVIDLWHAHDLKNKHWPDFQMTLNVLMILNYMGYTSDLQMTSNLIESHQISYDLKQIGVKFDIQMHHDQKWATNDPK